MQSEPPSRLKVAGTISFYMTAAIVVTVNKWVLVETTVPIFFIASQLFIAGGLIYLCNLANVITLAPFRWGLVSELKILIFCNTAGLTLGNLCLRYVDSSFYQVARGLVLPITVGFAFLLQDKPPSRQAVVSCVIVTCGFLVGCAGNALLTGKSESGVNLIGVIFGLSSSVVTAYHSMVIKKTLGIVNNSAIDLAFYSNVFSGCLMLLLSLVIGEGPDLYMLMTGQEPLGRLMWGTLATGVFGFLIGLAGLLSVKVTSPVSHMVSSAARGVLQTLVSVWFLGDKLTLSRMLSILVIIGGSCHYVWAQNQVEQPESKSSYELLSQQERKDSNEEKV